MKKLLNLFEKVWSDSGKYLVALIILTVPLYPKFPLLTIPGTYVAIRLEDFLILLVCLVWFFGRLRYFWGLKTNPLWRAFVLFWLIGLLATLSGILIGQTVQPFSGLLNWGRRIEYMIIFLICLDLKVTKKELKFFAICFAVVICYAFVYGVGQRYFSWPIITTQNSEYSKGIALRYMEGGHIVSTFAGHYDLASYLILVTPLLVSLAAYPKLIDAGKKKLLPIFLILSSIFGLWLLGSAASRISIVSFVGAVSLALILIRRIYLIPVVIIAVIIVLSMSGSLLSRYMNIFDVLSKQVHAADITTLNIPTPEPTVAPRLEDRSTNIRLAVEWPRAIRALTKNPLLGTGYSSITLATDNEYLRSLGEVGILGSLSFTLCFYLIFKEIIKGYFKEKKFTTKKLVAASAMGMIPGVFLNMVFIDILEASKFAILFWIFLGLTIAHLRQKNG